MNQTTSVRTAFIVLTYNRPDTLLQTLRGLSGQCDERHEIIIADDGSSQASIESVRAGLPSFKCPVRHVWHPDVGFTASRARNLAGGSSTADYFVFMDGDCIPSPRFVEGHSSLREGGYFVNGSRVLLNELLTKKILANEVDIQSANLLNWLRWRATGESNKLIHLLQWPGAPCREEKQFRWKKIRSCNFGVWRRDFFSVNGFDETFQGWGHEDADLVLRLHHAGLKRKNGFCATEVYHLWHRENSRLHEEENRKMVIQRIQTDVILAAQGVQDAIANGGGKVTRFN